MTNLEITLIYFAIGLFFTLITSEIRGSQLYNEDILLGTTCWPVIIIAVFGCEVYRRIKKWKRRADNEKLQKTADNQDF